MTGSFFTTPPRRIEVESIPDLPWWVRHAFLSEWF